MTEDLSDHRECLFILSMHIGSSGGPILDKCGNLVGVASSTTPVGAVIKDNTGNVTGHQQMVVKDAVPVSALWELLGH